eukprot:1347439-Amorphochlora_amoeboformis.AAC.1
MKRARPGLTLALGLGLVRVRAGWGWLGLGLGLGLGLTSVLKSRTDALRRCLSWGGVDDRDLDLENLSSGGGEGRHLMRGRIEGGVGTD